MDFGLNEEQQMMQTMARDFLTDEFPDKVLKAMAEDSKGYTPELWNKLAAANLTALAIPEEYGGVGDFLDLIVVLEEMGRACFISPFFSTTVLGASAIIETGSDEQKQRYLTGIAEGKNIITLAVAEESGKYTGEDIHTRAEPQDDDYIINGRKLFVTDAQAADYLICAARTGEGESGSGGISLFIFDINSDGITVNPLSTFSGDKIYEVILENVRAGEDSILGEKDNGWLYLGKVLQKANIARCAEMVGLAQQALQLTLDYAKERIAFGRPIGAFQSIQHRCADMLIDLDSSRYVTWQAAWKINEDLPAAREASIAKAWVSQACTRIVHSAHQAHGAIGFTEDHILHYYTKRVRSYDFSFGDADYHLEQLIKLC
jgi:alkylation response protein AidB-like acyl-CoA dehydrogenase